MKRVVGILSLFALISILLIGCTNPLYTKNVNLAYSKLRVGMTKSELDGLFKGTVSLKEQMIKPYLNKPQEMARKSLKFNKSYKEISPVNFLDTVSFGGDVKVYSYLEKKVLNWPNGTFIHYIAVFYDTKNDKVIGWAKLFTSLPLENWDERF